MFLSFTIIPQSVAGYTGCRCEVFLYFSSAKWYPGQGADVNLCAVRAHGHKTNDRTSTVRARCHDLTKSKTDLRSAINLVEFYNSARTHFSTKC
jgi:hypothetical protein